MKEKWKKKKQKWCNGIFLSTPKLTVHLLSIRWGEADWETENAVTLCKHCSAVIRTSLLSALFSSYMEKQKEHRTVCYEEN